MHTSPSGIELHRGCSRKWAYKTHYKLPVVQTQTTGQAVGNAAHAVAEALLSGKTTEQVATALRSAEQELGLKLGGMLAQMSTAGTDEIISCETKIVVDFAGHRMYSRADAIGLRGGVPVVIDHKIVSAYEYTSVDPLTGVRNKVDRTLTTASMQDNVQVLLCALGTLRLYKSERVIARWQYISRKACPKTRVVEADFSEAELVALLGERVCIGKDLASMDETLAQCEAGELPQAVRKTPAGSAYCESYGATCDYFAACIRDFTPAKENKEKEKDDVNIEEMMALRKRAPKLNAPTKPAVKLTAVPVEPAQEAAPAPEPEPAPEPKPVKATPKPAEATAEPVATEAERAVFFDLPAAARTGPTEPIENKVQPKAIGVLYIGCMPVSGPTARPFRIAFACGLATFPGSDPRQVDFGKGPGQFAAMLDKLLRTAEPFAAVYIDARDPLCGDVLHILEAHAAVVVRCI